MASRSTRSDSACRAALLDRLLRRHDSKLRRQAARHSRRAGDAEDALHDACVQFLRRYEGPLELSAALPWMLLVVKRCAWTIGARRRREVVSLSPTDGFDPRHPTLALADDCPAPYECVERSEEIAERHSLFARLKPDERAALLLFALGYSYREIMARQGWTYTKVNRCLSEGRAALRELSE